jgi:hypothetical protein
MRIFVLAAEVVADMAVELEVVAVGLEVVVLVSLLLVFSYFFSVVEMVDFPLG